MKNATFVTFILALLVLVPAAFAVVPTISGVAVTPSTSTAVVNWTVNATSYNNRVYYGETSSPTAYTATLVNNSTPRVTLSGLDTNTLYYYRVMSCYNSTSDCTNSSVSYFTTLCSTSDDVAVDCDVLEGLPSAGTQMGGFMSNLAPGIGSFILIVGLFLAIGGFILIIGTVGLKALSSSLGRK